MKEEKQEKSREKKKGKLLAKKDHVILQNEEYYELKKGEEVDVPERFLETLRAEKVI